MNRNWVRLVITVGCFRGVHGRWPSTVSVHPLVLRDLKLMLSAFHWESMTSRVSIVSDTSEEATLTAEDDEGRAWKYSRDDALARRDDMRARLWLGVEPDIDLDD
jgi:hypothetical protein